MTSTLWWVSVSDVNDWWLFCVCTISLLIWGVVEHHASGCLWDGGWMLHGSCIVVDWPSFHFICLNFTSLTFFLIYFQYGLSGIHLSVTTSFSTTSFIWQLISVHTKVPTLLLFHILPCYTLDQQNTMWVICCFDLSVLLCWYWMRQLHQWS